MMMMMINGVLAMCWLLGTLVPPQKWVTLVCFAERLLAVAVYDLWHDVMRRC